MLFVEKHEEKTDLILTAVRSLKLIVHLKKKITAVSIRSVFPTTLLIEKVLVFHQNPLAPRNPLLVA